MLHCFSLVSGLKINLHKSQLLGVGVASDRIIDAAGSIGCSIMKAPFKYLGFMVGGNMSKINAWDETVAKVCVLFLERIFGRRHTVCMLFPRLYALDNSKDCTVASKLQGVLRVKDALDVLDEALLPKVNVATRWIKTCPIKVNIFAWKMFLDCIPTRSNLVRRGVMVSSTLCSVCNTSVRICSFAVMWPFRFLTSFVVGGTCISLLVVLIRSGWSGLILSGWAPSVKGSWKAFFYVSWWCLWNFRNNLHFACSESPRKITSFWNDIWIGDMPLVASFPRLYRLDINPDCLVCDRNPTAHVPLSSLATTSDVTRHSIQSTGNGSMSPYFPPGLIFQWVCEGNQDRWECTIDASRRFTVKGMRSFITSMSHSVSSTMTTSVGKPIRQKEVVVLMLLTMDLDIQRNLAHLGAYDMLQELKAMFSKQVKQDFSLEINYIKELALQGLRGSKKLNPGALSLYIGNGQRATVEAIRNYHLCLPSGLVIVLNNCHYAPSITRGIISVFRLYDDGFINHFELNNAISVSKNNVVYFSAIPRDGVYEIEMSCSNTNGSYMYVVSNKRAKLNLDSSLLWHCRLGHISKKRIEKLQHDGLLNSTDIESLGKCVSCMSRKMAKKPYSHQVERAKDLLGLIHTDVCGPFRIVSRQGANYFVTFTDDFSRRNQFWKTIKSLRSDRGGEYMSQEFLDHLKKHGVIAHHTPPYTLQHNRVSERRNRTLLDMVRSMMSQTTHPKSFGDYALESVARILNMVPTKKVDKTPYEIWHGQAPKLSYLKVWGCEALVKRDTLTKPDKLEPRSFKCIFVGYPKETMGYSFYNPSENKVFVARNAEFFESNLIDQEASGSLEDLEIIQEEDTNPSLDTSLNHEEDDQEIDEPQSDINPIRRSSRTKRAPDRMCLYIDAEEHELGDLGEPANYKAALLDPESEKWLAAMNVEMQSMKDNDVWELVELPPNAKTVGHKWLFKKKTDMEGAIHTFKSRLVAKGFTQTYGVDYEETFSPVADIRAIRILIAIAAFYDYEIWQMDVKTAFLNGHLSEEVYMTQPEGFVNPKYPNHVCKLKRSIYGLKQASRQWNKRFDDEINKFGFTQNHDEPCVYQKTSGSYVTFLILYVDDILIMGNNISMLQDVKSYLRKCFAIKDLGEAAYILGIKIYKDISKCNVPYALAVGSIMYDVRCTRPDVVFTQNITNQFQQNPGELHWTIVKNILKYLQNTRICFWFMETGYVFVLNGGVVDWKSTKQSISATSSIDVEYIAAFDASKEAVWIRKFISGLNVVPTIEEPITMYCDNTGAIAIANEHGVTKVDVRIEKVDTDDNLADPFTKALAFPKHSELTRKIGLIPASSLM
ncbi:retrotransposon protein, putative, ty1-copia subclass [Tanacetum coccineum]|uniref:Retrotransposon protein, putative, ty1-copia subclass n=1 Tax=Tanacetum coccineum TaxID=301880 RepID=A0ABQ4WD29_9ASTR